MLLKLYLFSSVNVMYINVNIHVSHLECQRPLLLTIYDMHFQSTIIVHVFYVQNDGLSSGVITWI